MSSVFSIKKPSKGECEVIPRPTVNSVITNDFIYRFARELDSAWQMDKLFEFQMQYNLKNNVFFFSNIKSKLLDYNKLVITPTMPATASLCSANEELGITICISYANPQMKKDDEMLIRTQVVSMKNDSSRKLVGRARLEIECSTIKAKRDDPSIILEALEWIHEQFMLLDSNYREAYNFATSRLSEMESSMKDQIYKELTEFQQNKKQKVEVETAPKDANSI